jgi:hypothetical protein
MLAQGGRAFGWALVDACLRSAGVLDPRQKKQRS